MKIIVIIKCNYFIYLFVFIVIFIVTNKTKSFFIEP